MTSADRLLRKPIPGQEDLLERRLERDRAVHAAIEEGRPAGSVAREFGLTSDEVLEIHTAIEVPSVWLAQARYKARKRAEAAEARAALKDTWPPARIRNILTLDFGIPADRLGDAALIAETVTRGEILAVPMAGKQAAVKIAAFLEARGFALRD